jgi:hypothetical protein
MLQATTGEGKLTAGWHQPNQPNSEEHSMTSILLSRRDVLQGMRAVVTAPRQRFLHPMAPTA